MLMLMLMLALTMCGNQNPLTETVESETKLSENGKPNHQFQAKYEKELMMSSIGLTFLGCNERSDEIDNTTEAAENEQLEWKRHFVS
ncbi:MAG TPA: hypothetical protein DCW52_01365 [Gammaproteobacteria bacterium]|jgi:hypothetical protein|nr:hypothetical protein [Gammaproteobacteria bacterium]